MYKKDTFVVLDFPLFCSCMLATPLHLGELLSAYFLLDYTEQLWILSRSQVGGHSVLPPSLSLFPLFAWPSVHICKQFFSVSPLWTLCPVKPSSAYVFHQLVVILTVEVGFLLQICYPHGLSWERFPPIAFFLIQIYMECCTCFKNTYLIGGHRAIRLQPTY